MQGDHKGLYLSPRQASPTMPRNSPCCSGCYPAWRDRYLPQKYDVPQMVRWGNSWRRTRADKSAVCTINRLPVPQTGSLRVPQAFDHLVEQLGECTEGVGHECTLAALVHACSIGTQIDYW